LPKILIYSTSSAGGLAEHTYYQAEALERAGAKVICLISPSFLKGRKMDFEIIKCLSDPVEGSSGLVKKLRMAWRIISNNYVLAWQIIKQSPDLVLLDSYVEYLSPLWIDPHILLSRSFGVRYAANLHDPVRSYAIGPKWWHRLSVWLAYQPLNFVLVHDKLPDPSPVPDRVRVVEVPVGIYEISNHSQNHDDIRSSWGANEEHKVFLSFGYVRDGKNLDLAIRALKDVTCAFLVIAGSVSSSKDKQFSFYRDLAKELGVNDRCLFFEGFIPDDGLGGYFAAADYILLTYSASFYSQSGVLNIAARARKPVLASASPSPLMEAVRKYSLGVTIPPDSLNDVVKGMRILVENPPQPLWQEYESSASWDLNAQKILEAAKCVASY
jgi:glycosyltransferase involved in cell wall biosynthesis